LGAAGSEVLQVDALGLLAGTPTPYDLVFLDPPFDEDLVPEACARLRDGWLKPGAWVYVEHAADKAPVLSPEWQILRESRAGRVGFRLVTTSV